MIGYQETISGRPEFLLLDVSGDKLSMKIRLIEPRSRSNSVYDHIPLPRLGLPLIGKLLTDLGHDVRIYVEVLAPVDWNDLAQADLIGFSTITATAVEAYRMADRLRAQGKTVVFGGSHVTFMPDEALLHADYVVRGEGHHTMVELVRAIEQGTSVAAIQGLSYHGPDGPVHNPDRPNCSAAAFRSLPWPDVTLIVGHEHLKQIPVMTQWGCPFDCNFCSVIKMFGRNVRARPIDDVLNELEAIPPERREVFFYDDNFVVNKKRTKALLRGMIERKLNVAWSAQMRAETIYKSPNSKEWDTELLELMRESGCEWVYIGFESVNPEALKEYNKRQTVEQIAESIKAFHAYNIPIHGMFVLGCDADNPATIRATVDFAISHKIDTVQFLTITPFPGTEFYQQMKEQSRIISDDWSHYNGHIVVIQPAQMTPYELQIESLRAMVRFYTPRRAWGMLLRNVLRDLPFLLKLFLLERRLNLSQIVWMSLHPSQWLKLTEMLQNALDVEKWRKLRSTFIIPAIYSYAHVHIKEGLNQPEVQRYLSLLASMK